MKSWYHMTWEEIKIHIDAGHDAALLPIGANEQHGPHLGCGVDACIAETVCKGVANNLPVNLLPTQIYGCSIGHSHRWPGTLALSPKTLIDVIKDVGDWAYAAGIRRLFLINSHVTNFAPLRCALEMLRADHDDLMVALINTPEISQRVRQEHFHDAGDWHANDAETSLMLAIDYAMVRPEKIAESDDEDRTTDKVFSHPVNRTSSNGVTGKPSLGSLEKGEQLLQWMIEDLTQVVEKGMTEVPPLTASYYERLK